MFETNIGRLKAEDVPRRTALIFDSLWCLMGLAADAVWIIIRSGPTRGGHLLVYSTIVILSLFWFVRDYRSASVNRYAFGMRSIIFVLLSVFSGVVINSIYEFRFTP
jgi:hypothetical protein